MKIYIGNAAQDIDCNKLVETCKEVGGHTMYGPGKIEPGNIGYEEYKLQYDMMETAGYLSNGTVKFTHYYPGKQFDESISNKFAELCGVRHLGSFISSVDPGYCAPWHHDIFNNFYRDAANKYEMKRFVMFLTEPKPAQGFCIEDEMFYMEEQGAIYQFPDIHAWHAGFNVGLETKFIFTLTGAAI